MEQHLTAMDIPHLDSPDDGPDAYTTAAEYPQAPAPSTQGQEAASSSASDSHVFPESAEPQDTTMKLESVLPVSPLNSVKTLKLKTPLAKSRSGRPRFLTLTACVSYLLFHLMGINIGLRIVQGYTEPRLQQAKVQLDTTQQALNVDFLLEVQLSNLHHVTLQRSYKETRYEDCLVRGLHRATLLFGGLDFTLSPHVRNQTADWVTSSCDRLFYAPQLLNRDSKLRVRAEEILQSIEGLFRTFRYRLALLQSKLHVGNPQLAAKYLTIDSIIENNKHPRVLPDVPYGFGFDCQNQTRCCLMYTGPVNPANTVKPLKDAVTDARKEVEKWSYNFERIFRLMSYLIELLAWLQLMCIVQYLFATIISMRRPAQEPKSTFAEEKARVWNYLCYCVTHVEPQEKHAVGLLINTVFYALFGLQLEYIIPEFDRLLFPVGLGFCVFHSVFAAVFVQPAPENHPDGSLHDAVRAVRELCLIAQGIEPPEPAQTKALTPRPKSACPAKPASKIAARFISPLTPIAEDLQQERKSMHAEQGKPLNDPEEMSGYVPELDEEYDSDVEHSTYVDLAGGVTLTDSEDDGLILVGG